MTIKLIQEKRYKINREIKKYRSLKICKIRSFAEFLGTIVLCCPAIRYGIVHTKAFERTRYLALKVNNDCYDKYMTLDDYLQPDFIW